MAEIDNHPQLEVYKEELFCAVREGDLMMIKAIAQEIPALLNSVHELGFTVFQIASLVEKLSVIEWLLSDEGRVAGFNSALSTGEKDMTALDISMFTGNLECFKAIVKGCKVENGEREQMLNAVNDLGKTVLHSAVMQGRPTIIQWLLSDEKGGGREAGFNNIFPSGDISDITALHKAAEKGNLECFVAIVEGCKVENGEREKMLNVPCYDGSTVLHIAARHNHPSIIKWLLSKGRDLGFTSILVKDDDFRTALHVAAQEGHLEACKAIVEGCIVETGEREEVLNGTEDDQGTALHYAADDGHISVVSWLLSNEEGGGRALGFKSVFARMYDEGSTALHTAAQHGQLEACKAILKGCQVENGEREKVLNATDYEERTVLDYAAAAGRTLIVSWLLSNEEGGGRTLGFNSVLARTEENGSMALHTAAQHGQLETFKAILEGCKVDNGEREQMLKGVDENGATVLHYSLLHGRPNMVAWVLSHDADGGRAQGLRPDAVTNNSQSSLHFAAASGSVETLRALLSGCTVGERLKLFLAVDKWGWTPLYYAARPAIIRELLLHHEETKMIVDHRDHRGMTALQRVVLDGGVDEESKKEWFQKNILFPRARQEELVAGLLTYEYDDDDPASSTKSNSKKRRRPEQKEEEQEREDEGEQQQQQQQQQEQVAFIDVNLGLKIE